MTTHPLSPHLLKKDIWPPRFKEPQSLHYLTLSGSLEGGTLTMIVFPDQSKDPALVLRLLRDDTELPHFLNERDVLLHFQTLSPYLKNSVPKLLFCENIEGRWMLGESVVEGEPLKDVAGIDLAFTWLLALAHETQKSSATGQTWSKAAEDLIAEFQNHFLVSAGEQNFFRDMLQVLRAHGPKNPIVYLVHGDFSRHNLFISEVRKKTGEPLKNDGMQGNEELLTEPYEAVRRQRSDEVDTAGRVFQRFPKVIDWMSARWSPFPLHDACLLLTTYSLQNRKEPGFQGYLKVFSDSFFAFNDFSQLAKRWLLGHCAGLGLNPKLLPFFFGLCLMEQSLIEYKRILALSKRGYIPRGTIYRGSSENYEQALKSQIWTEFFHFFVSNRSSFIGNL